MKQLNPHDLGTRKQVDRFSSFYYEVDHYNGPCARNYLKELQTSLRNNIGRELHQDLESAEWPIRLMFL